MTATLIGLTGKKRTGKDTVAARLVSHHGFVRVAFADPLKEAALGLDPLIRIAQDETGPLAEHGLRITAAPVGSTMRLAHLIDLVGWEAAKEVREVRRTLQRYGVAIRDLTPSYWLDQALAKAAELLVTGTSVVIADVRFPNELEAIKAHGGFHWHVDRPAFAPVADPHPSETALEPFYTDADCWIQNTGSVQALDCLVDAIGAGTWGPA